MADDFALSGVPVNPRRCVFPLRAAIRRRRLYYLPIRRTNRRRRRLFVQRRRGRSGNHDSALDSTAGGLARCRDSHGASCGIADFARLRMALHLSFSNLETMRLERTRGDRRAGVAGLRTMAVDLPDGNGNGSFGRDYHCHLPEDLREEDSGDRRAGRIGHPCSSRWRGDRSLRPGRGDGRKEARWSARTGSVCVGSCAMADIRRRRLRLSNSPQRRGEESDPRRWILLRARRRLEATLRGHVRTHRRCARLRRSRGNNSPMADGMGAYRLDRRLHSRVGRVWNQSHSIPLVFAASGRRGLDSCSDGRGFSCRIDRRPSGAC